MLGLLSHFSNHIKGLLNLRLTYCRVTAGALQQSTGRQCCRAAGAALYAYQGGTEGGGAG